MPNQLFGMEIVDSKQLQKQFWSFDDYYDNLEPIIWSPCSIANI